MSTREVDGTHTYYVRKCGRGMCVFTSREGKFSEPHTGGHTHTHKHTHVRRQKHTQGHWSTVGITSDPWLGSHRALLVCVSVSPSYWDPRLCAHTVHTTVKLFVFVCVCFPVSAEGFKWRREAEEERKEGEKSKQAWRQRGKKGEMRTREYAIALFVSIPPSLPHSPTHSSKYNDHKKGDLKA